MLNKADIQSRTARPTKSIDIPEWGGAVIIQSLSVDERMQIQAEFFALAREIPRDEQGTLQRTQVDIVRARRIDFRMLALTLRDEIGAPMFTEAEISEMAGDQADVLARIVSEAYAMNGFKAADVVEDIAKN